MTVRIEHGDCRGRAAILWGDRMTYDATANAEVCYAAWIRHKRRELVLAGEPPLDDEERAWVAEAASLDVFGWLGLVEIMIVGLGLWAGLL